MGGGGGGRLIIRLKADSLEGRANATANSNRYRNIFSSVTKNEKEVAAFRGYPGQCGQLETEETEN